MYFEFNLLDGFLMLIEPGNQTLVTQKNYRQIIIKDYCGPVGSCVC